MEEYCTENFILETCKHIDHVQKETIISNATSCLTCETSLVSKTNNTIPVSFILCSGEFLKSNVLNPCETTTLYRIECVRDNRYLTLRCITTDECRLTCTKQTVIFDLNCCCQMQCYASINCEEC